MNAQPFFVTGLPRSRTTWLANWLTAGRAFCFHDLLADCARVEDMQGYFQDVAHGHKLAYVGNADSGLPLVWRKVQQVFPAARWLVVERDMDEALMSCERYFRTRPYAGTEGTLGLREMREAFKKLRAGIKELSAALPEGSVFKVPFDGLDRMDEAEKAWKFLLPTEPFNIDRWALLDGMRINPAPEKRRVDPARYQAMMQEARC